MNARRGYATSVLFLVGVFNVMDRQILALLLEPIKRDLGVSDTALGLLTGLAFVSFYTLASVPIARLADTCSRRHIVAAALAFWSAMTALSGMAASFAQLALLRVGVGIGEAATAPASQSMVADLFPRERRAGALSFLAASTPVGLMAAFLLGGWLSQAVGWRLTLVLAGVPGVVLAVLVWLTVAEPRRGGSEPGEADTGIYDLRTTLSYLAALPSLRLLTAGAALNVFAGWSLLVWSPAFLARVHGVAPATAGAWLGLAAGVGGAAGSVLCGLVAQRLARRDSSWLLGVPALTTLLALPFIALFLTLPSPSAAVPMFFGVVFFGPAMTGPVTTAIQGLAKVRMRAMAAAVATLVYNAIGVGLGPLVAGALSDGLAPALGASSLRAALLVTAGCGIVGSAAFFALGARRLRADLARAALSAAA